MNWKKKVFIGLFICFCAISIGFSQTKWTVRESGTDLNLKSIVWTGAKLVVVGDSGIILTSDNGENWESCSSGTKMDLSSIAWASKNLFASGDSGIILSSDNYINWVKQISGKSKKIIYITWLNNHLLGFTVSDTNPIITSIDGVNWSSNNSSNLRTACSIVRADSLFVAVGGYPATISTSTDCLIWTTRWARTETEFYSVTYMKGFFIVAGEESFMQRGIIFKSPDGINWGRAVEVSKSLYFITWAGEKLITIGKDGFIATSIDSETWTPQSSGSTRNLRCVTFTGTQYVAVGDSGTIITSPADNNNITRKPVQKRDSEDISLKRSGKIISVHIPYSLQGSSVSVFSLAGKRFSALSRKVTSSSFEIDSRNLAPGVYQIVVEKQGIKTAELFAVGR
ncbi:MAG: hypothetical protein JXB49_29780 [Bacteroidales bacterium]|nr:hypothetical protein [Bacteroidales bacterium]